MSRSPSVGGTLEYLDDVVSNPLCHLRLQGAAHGRLHRKASGVFNYMLDADEIESGKPRVLFDFDQHVEIAVGPGVVARPRPKDRELRHSLGFQRWSGRSDRADNLVAGHKVTLPYSTIGVRASSRPP